MTVAELLSKPEAWTKGVYARSRDGASCPAGSDEAVAWCLDGAMDRCHPNDWIEARRKLRELLPDIASFHWNDKPERTHAEVLALVQKAGV
jgi:hypothetical protein